MKGTMKIIMAKLRRAKIVLGENASVADLAKYLKADQNV